MATRTTVTAFALHVRMVGHRNDNENLCTFVPIMYFLVMAFLIKKSLCYLSAPCLLISYILYKIKVTKVVGKRHVNSTFSQLAFSVNNFGAFLLRKERLILGDVHTETSVKT